MAEQRMIQLSLSLTEDEARLLAEMIGIAVGVIAENDGGGRGEYFEDRLAYCRAQSPDSLKLKLEPFCLVAYGRLP